MEGKYGREVESVQERRGFRVGEESNGLFERFVENFSYSPFLQERENRMNQGFLTFFFLSFKCWKIHEDFAKRSRWKN